MPIKKKGLLYILIIWLVLLSGCQEIQENSIKQTIKTCSEQRTKFSINFLKTNNHGDKDERGINHVIIFNPKSEALDFKVNVGLSHKLYAKDNRGKLVNNMCLNSFMNLLLTKIQS